MAEVLWSHPAASVIMMHFGKDSSAITLMLDVMGYSYDVEQIPVDLVKLPMRALKIK